MEMREKVLCLVCLVLFVFVGQALALESVAVSHESESVSPLALEGNSNTFYGMGAGNSTTGDDDGATFIGYRAGYSNTTGFYNTFLGYSAGRSNTTGGDNTFIGYGSGYSNTTGYSNTSLGLAAGHSNTAGHFNSFLGYHAGWSNTMGNNNTFVGHYAGQANTTGSTNTFLGYWAGAYNTTGYWNTSLGDNAGYSNTTGVLNVFIGHAAGYNETASNRLYIANSDTSTPLIYGEFDNNRLTINGNLEVIGPDNGLVRLSNVTTDSTTKMSRLVLRHYSNGQLPVYLFGAASTATDNFVAFGGGNTIGNAATQIDLYTAPNTTTPIGTARITVKGNGYVGIGTQSPAQALQMAGGAYSNGAGWFNASSREYKDNIKDLRAEDAMEALKGLNPVSFNYKASADEGHVGFIAEEVPELVATRDRKGLSPMDIVAVLTKVVQEQQRVIQEQQKTAQDQQNAISLLREELNELKGRER